MRTVRRLYFYMVAFISLEAMLWGIIQLARTSFEFFPGELGTNLLARGLSLVLVGLPVFWLHWSKVQKDAVHDEEERISQVRAVFLYGARLATLIPVYQNILAVLNRATLTILDLSPASAFVGSGQNLNDNLIAIAVNLAAWYYFGKILEKEWGVPHTALVETRRVYRAAWVLYGLVLTLAGSHQVVRYIFSALWEMNELYGNWLGNGIALALVGTPIWAWNWRVFCESVTQAGERDSLLRMGLLFFLALGSATTAILALANVLAGTVRWMLGETQTLGSFLNQEANAAGLFIPFCVLWTYSHGHLQSLIDRLDDSVLRGTRRRQYKTVLSLIGVISTFFGMWLALDTGIVLLLEDIPAREIMRGQVGRALASLLAGVPLWLKNWLSLQEEAKQSGVTGNLARQSTERRGYLYLLLFGTVIGGMFSAGWLLYFIITSLLEGVPQDFWIEVAHRSWLVVLTAIWLLYHLVQLRQDDRLLSMARVKKHASFPTLILKGSEGSTFAEQLAARLKREMPRLPVAVYNLESDCLDDSVTATQLVVLPVNLAANPPESLRTWLTQFRGDRILVPLPDDAWIYVGAAPRSDEKLINETVRIIRQTAEGEKVQPGSSPSGWNLIGTVLAVLFALLVMINLIGVLFSSFD